MSDSIILMQAYEKFLLFLGGKKVPTPYRINIPFQPDRRRYGKSDPDSLTSDTIQIAKEKNFDLNMATLKQIREFMEENQLGIDCSGFVYHLLAYLLKKIGKGSMKEVGFPKASSTNVEILTSDQFSIHIERLDKSKPGDLIKLDTSQSAKHCVVILGNQNGITTYAHSSGKTKITGVHTGQIKNGKLPEDLKVFSYNEKRGDGVRRLKILA